MNATTLAAVAMNWLRYHRRCFLVSMERPLKAFARRRPDVLAVNPTRRTIEIEIKCSRADFIADGKKRGVDDPRDHPSQFYFMVAPDLAEFARDYICNAGLSIVDRSGHYARAGLLTVDMPLDPWTRLPSLKVLRKAPVQKQEKLSIRQIARMIQNQSGTLARLASTLARLSINHQPLTESKQ